MSMQTSRTLCGPHDTQFNRKFRGRISSSLAIQRIKLVKDPTIRSYKSQKKITSEHQMLPKLKELQTIAKTQRRKRPTKINKYVDGVSDLQLYIANKALNNQGTKQIVGQLMRKSPSLDAQRKTVIHNYMKMGVSAQNNLLISESKQNENLLKMSLTEYTSASPKKWVSDQQFIQKFDKFIVIKREQDTGTTPKDNGVIPSKQVMTKQQIEKKISHDKEKVTRIARKMIADQNLYTQEEDLIAKKVGYAGEHETARPGPEECNIKWIIKECREYERRFVIRKNRKTAKN